MSQRVSARTTGIISFVTGGIYCAVIDGWPMQAVSSVEIALAQAYALPLMLMGAIVGIVVGIAIGIASHRWSNYDSRRPSPTVVGLTMMIPIIIIAPQTIPKAVSVTLYFSPNSFLLQLLPCGIAFVAFTFFASGIRCLVPWKPTSGNQA